MDMSYYIGLFLFWLAIELIFLSTIMVILINIDFFKKRLTNKQHNLYLIFLNIVVLVGLCDGAIIAFYFAHLSYTDPLGYETLFAIGILTFILVVEVIRYRKKFGKSKDRKEGIKNVSGLSDK